MKATLLLSVLFTYSLCLNAQWQPTGISTNTIEGVYDVVSHNGQLFASVNTAGFIKSTDNGASWAPVGQTGFVTNANSRRVTHLRSTGTALYAVTFYANNASSMIYKSIDNGQTFVADVVGIPANSGEIVDVDYFYSHNNYLVAVVNSGNYIKHVDDASWQKNTNARTEFSEHFAFYGGEFYAWGSYHLNVSTNNGQSWTASADANLPSYFLANNLVIDSNSGRIYVSGRSLFNYIHKLYYSDNEGASWTEINISSHLGNNWIGLGQTIQELFVNGNYIQFALDNNSNPSAPDIFVSTDGGASFSTDISGLPTNSSGTTTAVKFVLHNNNLFMALNFIDIYRKPFSTLSNSNVNLNRDVVVYPNPSKGVFNFKSAIPIEQIQVFNVQGKLIQSVGKGSQIENIKIDESGIYFVKVTNANIHSTIKKVVRN
ncbi:T9SS type A sorting domain-containing protein [Mariniflexile soesokkakense]|uniref:T9SS type A sorting domain-containing protein n=1 Tax=Mariniflexile soesokkakense TaxID=1343160 RepID=A0ABV0ADS2_9FLAO